MGEDMQTFFEQLQQQLYELGRTIALAGRPKKDNMGPFYNQGYDETTQLMMDVY